MGHEIGNVDFEHPVQHCCNDFKMSGQKVGVLTLSVPMIFLAFSLFSENQL